MTEDINSELRPVSGNCICYPVGNPAGTVDQIIDIGSPDQEYQPKQKRFLSFIRRDGRVVVRMCWVNFQCRGVLQFGC